MNLAVFWAGLKLSSPVLTWVSVAHVVALLFLFAAIWLDGRQVLGINTWIKPAKFVASNAIYLGTLAWLLKDLKPGPAMRSTGTALAVVMTLEVLLIVVQGARGVRSHFNVGDPLNLAVFSAMGVLILINTLAVAGIALWSFAPRAWLTPGYAWGIRLGLLLFLAGSLQAGFMLGRMSHTVGVPDGGPGLPFLNWSTTAGDLRIAHFVGIHGLQVLPLAGWCIDQTGVARPELALGVVAVAYFGVFVLLNLQALAGKPLFF